MVYLAGAYGSGTWGAGTYGAGDWKNFHPDTKSFRDRLVANGGQVSDDVAAVNAISNADLAAIDVFVRSAYANNYRQYYVDYCPLAGTGLLTAQVKLWYPIGVSDKINFLNISTGDFSRTTGLTGNGINKYANTNLNPVAQGLNLNDAHLSTYSRTNISNAALELGAQGPGGTPERLLIAVKNGNRAIFDSYNAMDGQGRASATITATASLRLFLASRLSAVDSKIFLDGTQIASSVTSGGTCPSTSVFLLALNNNGTAANYSARSLGDYSIGMGIPSALIPVVNSDRHALMTAFGRAV